MRSLRASYTSFVHSIRFRITLWFVLILGIVLLAFSAFIYFAQRRDLQTDAVGNMQEKLNRLQVYFRSAAWQNSNISPADVPGNAAPLQKGDLMILVDREGSVVQTWGAEAADSGTLVNVLISAANQNQGLGVYEKSIAVSSAGAAAGKRVYLFTVTPVVRGELLLGYLVVGSPSPLTEQLRRLMISLLLGGLGMLVIAFLGGLWLADRAMRPVKTITQTARGISETDLSRRLRIKGRDELAELAATFDGMLARLQAAFERQRRFLADASHELRTPLTIINMEVDRVLASPHKSEEYQRALELVDAEGQRMTRLVTELMTLARMDAGQAILHTEDLDLSEVAVDAVERMSPLAARQAVRIETGGLPELHVRGDRQYLLQMISNLIENAIKYSGRGQAVRVETCVGDDQSSRTAVLTVTDSGPGIPTEHLPHIFDRFYQVDEARARDADEDPSSPSGSGLGLSIVASIAKFHGGEVRVQSQPHSGSTFVVSLPLAPLPSGL